ncbi:MAG: hypothetical protein IT289_02380 [Oligoflexia bacterium]|nr:hypothetical protein [Oligoflexia bacterium]
MILKAIAIFSALVLVVVYQNCGSSPSYRSNMKGNSSTPSDFLPEPSQITQITLKEIIETDDFSSLLQGKINAAAQNVSPGQYHQILIPGGTFQLSKSIVLESNVWIKGEGVQGQNSTHLVLSPTALLSTFSNSIPVSKTVFIAEKKDHIVLSDFTLDVNSNNHESFRANPQDRALTAITLIDTSHSTFWKLSIKGFGKMVGSTGGQGILLSANSGGGTHHNRFKEIKLLDDLSVAHFGIRLTTDWVSELPDEVFPELLTHNSIAESYFTGCLWNTVEIAGPGTKFNRVEKNRFNHVYLTAFESDKGAKNNTFNENVIESIYKSPLKSGLYLMRDQGYPPNFGGDRNPERFTFGNEFIGNIFLGNPFGESLAESGNGIGAFRLVRSRNIKIEGNQIQMKAARDWEQVPFLSLQFETDDDSAILGSNLCLTTNGIQRSPCVHSKIEDKEP